VITANQILAGQMSALPPKAHIRARNSNVR